MNLADLELKLGLYWASSARELPELLSMDHCFVEAVHSMALRWMEPQSMALRTC